MPSPVYLTLLPSVPSRHFPNPQADRPEWLYNEAGRPAKPSFDSQRHCPLHLRGERVYVVLLAKLTTIVNPSTGVQRKSRVDPTLWPSACTWHLYSSAIRRQTSQFVLLCINSYLYVFSTQIHLFHSFVTMFEVVLGAILAQVLSAARISTSQSGFSRHYHSCILLYKKITK